MSSPPSPSEQPADIVYPSRPRLHPVVALGLVAASIAVVGVIFGGGFDASLMLFGYHVRPWLSTEFGPLYIPVVMILVLSGFGTVFITPFGMLFEAVGVEVILKRTGDPTGKRLAVTGFVINGICFVLGFAVVFFMFANFPYLIGD